MKVASEEDMTYRIFEDPPGKLWEVWQVSPSYLERRKSERRTASERRARTRTGSSDRRGRDDRRVGLRRRFVGMPNLEAGWLCFESNGEKRRLAPVPEGWESADNRTLVGLCNSARKP